MRNTVKIAMATPLIAVSALGTASNAYAGFGGGGIGHAVDDQSTVKENSQSNIIDVLSNDGPALTSGRTIDTSTLHFRDANTGEDTSTLETKGGTVTIKDGQFSFDAKQGYTGSVPSFDYYVKDNAGSLYYASVNITVTPLVGPTAKDDSASTTPDTPITLTPLSNDVAGDSPITKVTLPYGGGTMNGTYVVNEDNTVTFTPNTNICSIHGAGGFAPMKADATPLVKTGQIDYTITDANGMTSTASMEVNITCAPPVAVDDTNTTKINTSVTTNVLSNDKVGEKTSTWVNVRLLQEDGSYDSSLTTKDGVYTVNDDNTVSFQPAKDFTGMTTPITYRAMDTSLQSADGTLTITVNSLVGPTAKDDSLETRVGVPVTIDPLKNDVAGDSPIVKVTEVKPSGAFPNATLTLNPDGTITVNPVPGNCDNGMQDLTAAGAYTIVDANGLTSTASISVSIKCDMPSAVSDNFNTKYNTPVTLHPTENDHLSTDAKNWDHIILASDQNGLNVSPATTLTVPQGTFEVKGVNVVFTPKDGYTGDVPSIYYRATDNNGLIADSTITGTVSGPMAPKAIDDSNSTAYETTVNTKVLDNDKAGETSATWSKVELKDTNGNYGSTLTTTEGVYTVKANNTVDFAPAAGFTGTAKPVTYVATDSNGNTADAKLVITVNNITPKATDDKATTSYNKPVVISILDNDAPGAKDAPLDPSTIVVTGKDASQGTWTVDTTTGKVTFTPAKDFTGEATASYTVKDKLGNTVTANITVTVEKEVIEPTATGVNDHATTKQDTPVVIDVLGNDKSNPGTIVKNSTSLLDEKGAPSDSVKVKGGTFTLKDGQLVFTPEKGFYGESGSVTYAAISTDGVTYRAKASVTVTKTDTPAKPTPESTTTPTTKPNPKPSTPTKQPSKTATPVTPTPEKPKPVTPGPVIQTDMAVGGNSSTGLYGLSSVIALGGIAALRRRRK